MIGHWNLIPKIILGLPDDGKYQCPFCLGECLEYLYRPGLKVVPNFIYPSVVADTTTLEKYFPEIGIPPGLTTVWLPYPFGSSALYLIRLLERIRPRGIVVITKAGFLGQKYDVLVPGYVELDTNLLLGGHPHHLENNLDPCVIGNLIGNERVNYGGTTATVRTVPLQTIHLLETLRGMGVETVEMEFLFYGVLQRFLGHELGDQAPSWYLAQYASDRPLEPLDNGPSLNVSLGAYVYGGINLTQ